MPTISFWRATTLSLSLLALPMTGQAQSGVPPQSPDEQAEPVSLAFKGVRHTGTDAIQYGDNTVFQVMTWDADGQVYLSWAIVAQNPGGTPTVLNKGNYENPSFGISYLPPRRGAKSDPDVVVARATNGKLYVNLVYIDGGRTQYEGYEWVPSSGNQGSFNPTPVFSTPVGHPASVFRHEYPNLDANAEGLVALTWQETVDDQVTVDVTSSNMYFPPYSFTQNVTFGRTYLAASDIQGNVQFCTTANGIVGILARDPPTGLFEQTLHPDIAISEGDASKAVISSTFLRHYVDGANQFSIVNRLDVRQYHYTCQDRPGLDTLGTYSWAYSNNNTLGSPRIASPSPMISSQVLEPNDFEIVVDRPQPTCGVGDYAILDYGKIQGVFRPEPTLVNPNYLTNRSEEPAVSYGSTGASYTVTWTGENYDNGQGLDVWAIDMKGGTFTTVGGASTGMPAPLAHSRVNFADDGTQWSSSLAGRHIEAKEPFSFAYLFANDADDQVSFRYSNTQAGIPTPGLRPGSGAGTAQPTVSPKTNGTSRDGSVGLLQAYPNPAADVTTLALHLRAGEQVRSVRVLDLTGRQVADLTPPRDERAENRTATDLNLSWKPGPLPAGSYVVQVVTSARTQRLVLSRN